MKVSMQQIADRLGVSKYSVSKALSGKPGVSMETRLEVIETAKAMGYRWRQKKTSGASVDKALPNKKNKRPAAEADSQPFIFVLMDSSKLNEVYFWNRVLAGIINGCNEVGWNHLMITNSSEDTEFNFPAYADRSACAGIVIIGDVPASYLLSLKKLNIPIVLTDHEEPLSGLDCVVNSNFEAARALCKRIVDSGCRSILFIGSDHHSVSFTQRWWGCQNAVFEENQISKKQLTLRKWSLPPKYERWLSVLEEKIAGIQQDMLPDAIVCANDEIAFDLLNLFKKYHFSVPEQCKVVGFDNTEKAAHSIPPLTTVDLGKEMLGYRAIEALQRRIAKPGSPPEKILLTFRLVERESG
ncbi:LacI family DNA-binding transcriptional regulator [Paenibacillus sp. GCM10012303]|jgi:LacI family transcriptional regulator|uniref:LacI family DNA-binding transcriptional regulator n=1 Tax=Paenibacillus sp. GCM10012303 TaxID=3317340 RepID=UPI00362221CA